MAYLGASPPAVFSAPTKDTFSGNASTKTFTLSKSAGGANAIQVFVDNVRQEPIVAYSVNDKTLNFTSAPASGTDNIYVINASAILSNGLLPTLGRDNDKVTNMEVTSDLSVDGQVAGNIMFSILEETDGGNLVLEGTDSSQTNADKNVLLEEATADINKVGQVDTSTFQFDNNVLVKGNVEIQGNLAAPSTGDRITVESGTDASTGFLLLDSSAASTDVGEQILFEDGTSDPQNFFNTNAVFGASVKIGSATIEEDSNQLKINDQVVSFGKTALSSTLVVATDTFAGATDSVLLDFNAHNNFILTLDGSITLANPSTENVGQTGVIVAIQDGSGSRTITLGGDYESVGGAGLTLSSGANAVDIIPYIVVAANRIALGTPQLAFG